MGLRDYQLRAISSLRASYARGRRAPCLVMPCGAGKTVVSAEIIRSGAQLGTRSLFVADRCTLIDQTVAKLRDAGVTDLRVIQAERDEGNPTALATVASAQTLRTPGWQSRLPEADLVIWDECHAVAARSYDGVLQRYPRARLLGLSATPCRGDNKPLSVFDCLVVGATTRQLIDLGNLAPSRVLAPPSELEDGQIALDPVAAYRRHADGRRAAVFCVSVKQAQQYVGNFQSAGVSAEVVTAFTRDRADVLARFAAERFSVLCSVGTLTQGWDDPGCGVAIVARKPNHVGLWLQICGRVLRPHPSKQHGLIIDLGGAVWTHGTPDMDREYSLSGKAISSVTRDQIRHCAECGSISLSGPPRCPFCGAEFPIRSRPLPRSVDVGVTEVQGAAPRREYVVSMVSKRGGWCARCGRGIKSGEPIYWASLARKARHRQCPAPSVGVSL